MRVAVLMLNLGGPRRPEDVKPFLRNVFSDRETIPLPGGRVGQWALSWLIATLRAPSSAASYAEIGGGSPLVKWTREQGRAMAAILESETDLEVLALPCMRYWHPFAREALAEAVEWGAEHVVAFSQYPHRCSATGENSLRNVFATAERMNVAAPITAIESWHDHPGYVAALAECVAEAVQRLDPSVRRRARVVYSAHSLPWKLVERGDPYPEQVRRTVELVHAASGVGLEHEIAWQSRVRGQRWLGPATSDRIPALPGEGVSHVVVVPVSFTSDHVETLHELDIVLAREAAAAGVESFVRAPALNTRPTFVRALADLVRDHLRAAGVIGARRAS